MCVWLLNSMKTSGPAPDWIAEVTRGGRPLPFTVSSVILMPSAFIASGTMDLRSSSSDAGTKSFHLIQCTEPCCANAGAWRATRIPAIPAFRKSRRLNWAMLSSSRGWTSTVLLLLVAEGPRQPERKAGKVGDDQKRGAHRAVERPQLARDLLHRHLADRTADEQGRPHRRRDEADAEVEQHDHA